MNLRKTRSLLAAQIRQLREQAGLRQEDLAEALDVPQSVISRIENGHRRVDLVELRQVCEACKVPLKVFVKAFEAELDRQNRAR